MVEIQFVESSCHSEGRFREKKNSNITFFAVVFVLQKPVGALIPDRGGMGWHFLSHLFSLTGTAIVLRVDTSDGQRRADAALGMI